ncbi:hypothetical protein [Streptomyces sp. 1-11]|uniref:hypothetical protein n=1 Tax=Streptomyces sp. 1-11 TaxID=2590549 RepID=UPI0011717FEB|nr:hypothetical protein [Streptomyces sp. 1-11]GEK04451.1 hypothetical protein TNCT1_67270 [Streptomyces sp. 1-11]
MARSNDTTPVLPSFLEPHAHGHSLRVWCRWCCDWHSHGHDDTPVGDTTHRGAHCYAPDSEYNETDYWIRVTGIPFSTARKTIRTATAAQQRAIRDGRISEAVQQLRAQEPDAG